MGVCASVTLQPGWTPSSPCLSCPPGHLDVSGQLLSAVLGCRCQAGYSKVDCINAASYSTSQVPAAHFLYLQSSLYSIPMVPVYAARLMITAIGPLHAALLATTARKAVSRATKEPSGSVAAQKPFDCPHPGCQSNHEG